MKTNKISPIKGIITQHEIKNLFSDDDFLPWEEGRFEFIDREPLGSILPNDSGLYDYYEEKYLRESRSNYELNNFVPALELIYDKKLVKETINKYKVGTSKSWKGASVFWYIDTQGKICGGEIKNYTNLWEKSMGFNDTPYFDTIQSQLYKKGMIDKKFRQKSVFFGEHLILDKKKPIAIVESERTAIVASMEYPNYTWLATGHNTDLDYDRMKILIGRDITLCPNNDNFNLWYEKDVSYEIKISLLVKSKGFFRSEHLFHESGNNISQCKLDSFSVEEYFNEEKD